jgi:ribosomal protein S18 acetylase RimI-like enzyme
MVHIRHMTERNADAVRQIDAAAFSVWASGVWERPVDVPQRTRDNVLGCLEKDPQGCFVAEEAGQVVGFIFSRTWGRVGWFGTFGVLPEHQRRGIGRRLIAASLQYLRQEPGRVIGLETMADSPSNVGLYVRLGFQLRSPTLRLAKDLGHSTADDVDMPRWSDADEETQQRWLDELRGVTGRIPPGLDYSKEILSTVQHCLGEVLVLLADGRAIGVSVIELAATREGPKDDNAHLRVMALHPDHTNERALCSLLGASEAAAHSAGKRSLLVPVNGKHVWAIAQLLRCGYRVDHLSVRMVLEGTDDGPRTDRWVDFSRWAG